VDSVDLVRGDVFDGLPVAHGFTARRGGVDHDGRRELTLLADDSLPPDVLSSNWARALESVHPSLVASRLTLVRQVHGDVVLRVAAPTGPLGAAGDADALITTVPGLAVAVRVADCVPILLAAPGGVAAVHAGWRGVAAGIAPKAAALLAEAAGCAIGEVRALIGPHIGQDAFEVGPEVVAAIEATGPARAGFARPGRDDRQHVDLGAALHAQLVALGVGAVASTGGDTTTERFFSWRADGPRTGRQAGIVAWLG
jgi:YfiH family protein